jgi:hypothetical protein
MERSHYLLLGDKGWIYSTLPDLNQAQSNYKEEFGDNPQSVFQAKLELTGIRKLKKLPLSADPQKHDE